MSPDSDVQMNEAGRSDEAFAQPLNWDFDPNTNSGSQDRDDNIMGASPSKGEHDFQGISSILATIWKSSKLREDLCNLRGAEAQLIIDYLYSVQSISTLPEQYPWLHRHCIIALYKLSAASQLYPRCYTLKKSIVPGSRQPSGGGFGDIFKGMSNNKELCFKVVRLFGDDLKSMLKIYTKEAILWGQLHHPNIVPFYGIYYMNQELEQICLVSPWMRHGNLPQYLKNTPSPPRELLAYDVASGLSYLHERGLIHSDLKGANILVDNNQQACITNFGASFIHTDKTLSRAVGMSGYGFTPRWAAPELLDEDVRPTMASDIWALGCVFWEILTGKAPYDALTDVQVIRAQMGGELPGGPSPSIYSGTLWEEAQPCWMINPAHRPACWDILVRLRQAGISRGENNQAQRGTEQEIQEVRNALQMDHEVPVDLGAVKHALEVLYKRSI